MGDPAPEPVAVPARRPPAGRDRLPWGVVVCGAGPAGLMAAIAAASALAGKGHCPNDAGRPQVLLLEKMPSCARKLLLSGSGQCNLTHAGDIGDFEGRYGGHGKFLRPALRSFTNADAVAFFADRGCPMETEAGGKVFPASRRAADILSVLERECVRLGVELRRGRSLLAVASLPEGGFLLRTNEGECRSRTLCLATGGLSYPGTGSTGDGYALAKSLGHGIVPTAPALAAVIVRGHDLSACAGMSFPGASFSLWRSGRLAGRHSGDVLLTHRGLSGPGILDASRSMESGDRIELSLVGLKDGDEAGADELLLERLASCGAKSLAKALSGLLPERLLESLLRTHGLDPGMKAAKLGREGRRALARSLAAHPFEVEALEDIATAMATRGGVCLDEVDPKTMMSRIAPGLFFAGELLDIDGDTGGYNIQAAFSTGWLAGRSAAAFAG